MDSRHFQEHIIIYLINIGEMEASEHLLDMFNKPNGVEPLGVSRYLVHVQGAAGHQRRGGSAERGRGRGHGLA